MPVTRTPWEHLRRLTAARIALGRAGSSLPTAEVLAFELAHSRAKVAVYTVLDEVYLSRELSQSREVLRIQSQAGSREIYLTRPDLGRLLTVKDETSLRRKQGKFDLVIVVADGLSAVAVNRHAVPLLEILGPLLEPYALAPVILAKGARVALADAIGDALGAKMSLILIGERPGLSTPESLGAYLTHAPRPGRLDSERNCVSNIHPAGLSNRAAAHLLSVLIREAVRQGLTGVGLKVEGALTLPPEAPLLGE